MELKDFIKATIKDISNAVSELNDEMKDTGLQVNPLFDSAPHGYRFTEDGATIQEIDFKLQVSASEKTEAGGGFYINVIKAGANTESGNSTVSTLEFQISVALPVYNK